MSLDATILLTVAATLAFLATYIALPHAIRWEKSKGIVGVDVHKIDKPARAKTGGVVFASGYFLATLTVASVNQELANFALPLFTLALVVLVGLYDDLFNLRQRVKVLLLFLCGIPLALRLGTQTTINFPVAGAVDFGVLYPILLVPLAVTVAGNLTNMLAGYNGLEASLGIIAVASIAVASIIRGEHEAALMSAPMVFALLAFLIFNWYPAKIFPGDAGTLTIGATIATVALIAGLEIMAVILLAPHLVDFLLKLVGSRVNGQVPFSQRKIYGDTRLSPQGHLVPPDYLSLLHVIARARPMTEKALVQAMLMLELALGMITIGLAATRLI